MAPSAAPAPKPPAIPAPVQDDSAAKAAADAARAAEKNLQKKRRGRQSLILTPPTGEAVGGSGDRGTSILGGGQYPR